MTRWRMTLTEPPLADMDILEELSQRERELFLAVLTSTRTNWSPEVRSCRSCRRLGFRIFPDQ